MTTPEQLAQQTDTMRLINVASRAVDVLETYNRHLHEVPRELHDALVRLEIEVGVWKDGR